MIIRKLCATVTAFPTVTIALATVFGTVGFDAIHSNSASAQEAAADSSAAESDASSPSAESRFAAKETEVPSPIDLENAAVTYPRAVTVDGDKKYIVDLDLPGIWVQTDESSKVFTPGTKLLRKAMNRPWCVAVHPAGGLLIGDSATREIYHAKESGTKLIALNGGYLGIPMALAVDSEGNQVYVGDAERRAVFRLPIGGGKPELVARVNARGLSFDSEGNLWAITPDADAVVKIDVSKNSAETVVGDRPYQFPNGLVWAGEEGFVTDGYGKAIWRFTADGKTEKWFEGEPLQSPVGISVDENYLYVADPRSKQVYRFDRKDKSVEPIL
ncbi:hypothetical protein LOC67_24865 [Stieleria sp. JC731]|uniref:hypothetical protein n=1 Tax=Pirellulaceae TaxID=2691357 RepID=UPI001E4F166B|nr:hypothetical protein [Stieleria sp. JC731]MCC9603796.1 hypothetical protein [Stieleria sp. JC731]